MENIYQGTIYNDSYLASDEQISQAILYNKATKTSQEVSLTLRSNTTYDYDLSLTATQTNGMAIGVYDLELYKAVTSGGVTTYDMFDCIERFATVHPSSKKTA